MASKAVNKTEQVKNGLLPTPPMPEVRLEATTVPESGTSPDSGSFASTIPLKSSP